MANITYNDLDAVLKEVYTSDVVQDYTASQSAIYAALDKVKNYNVGGRDLTARIPFKSTRGHGVVWGSETSLMPVGSSPIKKTMTVDAAKSIRASFRVTDEARMTGGKDALEEVVASAKSDIMDGMPIQINRALCAGQYGELCIINGTITAASAAVVDNPGTQLLEKGMRIVTSSATGTLTRVADQDLGAGLTTATEYTVGPISSDTAFTIYDNANTAAQTDTVLDNRKVWQAGTLDASGTNIFTSLKMLFDNEAIKATSSWNGDGVAITTIQGLSRADYPELDIKVIHNSNSNIAFEEDKLIELLDKIDKYKKNSTDLMVTTYGIRRRIASILKDDRRYIASDNMSLPFGHTGLPFFYGNRNIPIIVDSMAPLNAILAIDSKHLAFYVAKDFGWETDDGAMFSRALDFSNGGKLPSMEAYYSSTFNIGCSDFQAQGAYRDISE